ncbi:hypothetical protein Scel_61720 [Streptomyces cellostaticus]|nr:hypothetical protein Scel_61720 [Streptomyces cellostaticus]
MSGRTADDATPKLRGEGVGLLQALAAAAKEKQPETHDAPQPSRAAPGARACISMRNRQNKMDKWCAISRSLHSASVESPDCHPISPITVAGSDTGITQCKGAGHDDQRGL